MHIYQGYGMNEFTWYTNRHNGKNIIQNSQDILVALSRNKSISTDLYYDWIEEMRNGLHLIQNSPILCKWIDN
jgi:hypothetical protein